MAQREHPGVKVIGWILVAVLVAAFGGYVWISEGYLEREEAWETVPVGARCEPLGAEERTYGGRAVFCVAFPHYGMQVWSWSQAELAVPVPAPADARQAQIRLCTHQSRLDERNCAAGIARYEGASAGR